MSEFIKTFRLFPVGDLARAEEEKSGGGKTKTHFFPENIHFIPRQLSFFPPKMYWAHSGNSPLYDAPLLFFFVHTLGLDGKNTIPPFLLLQSPCCHRRVKTPSFLLFPLRQKMRNLHPPKMKREKNAGFDTFKKVLLIKVVLTFEEKPVSLKYFKSFYIK